MSDGASPTIEAAPVAAPAPKITPTAGAIFASVKQNVDKGIVKNALDTATGDDAKKLKKELKEQKKQEAQNGEG